MQTLETAMRTLTGVGLLMLLTGCLGNSNDSALADGLRKPMGDLAGAVATHGAPAPVVSAVRVVVATYEAGTE